MGEEEKRKKIEWYNSNVEIKRKYIILQITIDNRIT